MMTGSVLPFILGLTFAAGAEEQKPPPPPWRVPPYPILSVPLGGERPTIDGKVDLAHEWRDAVVMSGCFQRDLDALAPPQAQLQFLLKLDQEFFSVGARSPVFPEGSALRSFEKRPDHLQEIMQGDHFALELLPLSGRDLDRLRAAGHFAYVWNSLGTLGDFHYNGHPGQRGLEWDSNASVKNRVSGEAWETEIRIPLARLKNLTMARHVSLPPKAGDVWGLRVARRFGEAGGNLFSTWDNADLAIGARDFGKVPKALSLMPRIRIRDGGVAVQLLSLGNLADGKLKTDIRLYNAGEAEHSVTVSLHIQSSKGTKIWSGTETVKVGPSASVAVPAMEAEPDIEERGSRLFIKIIQGDREVLYITPGIALVRFNKATWTQYLRSLEVLRE